MDGGANVRFRPEADTRLSAPMTEFTACSAHGGDEDGHLVAGLAACSAQHYILFQGTAPAGARLRAEGAIHVEMHDQGRGGYGSVLSAVLTADDFRVSVDSHTAVVLGTGSDFTIGVQVADAASLDRFAEVLGLLLDCFEDRRR